MATTESEDWATEEDGAASTDDVLEEVVSSYPTLEGDGALVLGDEENERDRTAVTSHPDLASSTRKLVLLLARTRNSYSTRQRKKMLVTRLGKMKNATKKI